MLFCLFALVGWHVTAALFDLDFHVQLATLQVGQDVIRVDDFDIMRHFDVRSTHNAFTRLADLQHNLITAVQLEHNALQIEEQVNHIFLHTVDGRVFVDNAIDLDFGRCIAIHRRQQDTTQGITQRMTITTLERLHNHLGVNRRDGLDIDTARL